MSRDIRSICRPGTIFAFILMLVISLLSAAFADAEQVDLTTLQGYAAGPLAVEADGTHAFWVKDRKTPVRGHLSRTHYSNDGSSAPVPSFQIISHFAEAVKGRGGEILYENPRNFLHARFKREGEEYWLEVLAEGRGEGFTMTLVVVPEDSSTKEARKAAKPLSPGRSKGPAPGIAARPAVASAAIRDVMPAAGVRQLQVVSAAKPMAHQLVPHTADTSWKDKYRLTCELPRP